MLLYMSAAASRRHTQARIDRETGWTEVAKLPGCKSQHFTAATGKRPRPAAARCWVSFLQQPTSCPAHALSPPLWTVGMVRLEDSVT